MDDRNPSSLTLRRSLSDDTTWLPAALLATLVLLVTALQSFGGEPAPLQWRAAGTSSAKPLSTTKQPVRRVDARKVDSQQYAVVQVAYEEIASPSTTIAGSARLKSVVVHPRQPQHGGPRLVTQVAQNRYEDDELSRSIDLPFGEEESDMPVLPDMNIDDLPEPTEPDLLDDMPEPTMPVDGQVTPQPGGSPAFRQPSERELERDSDPARPTTRAQGKYDEERRKAMESCEDHREKVLANLITKVDLNIHQTGKQGEDIPFECILDDGSMYPGRHWPEVTYMWKAAANCHKPLYFEQVQLERYGHSWGPCVQPLVSGAHFFTRLPVLPYCMGITPPNECMYPLGYYRPGNCAPYMIPAVPFTWRAVGFQAGATVGTAAFLP